MFELVGRLRRARSWDGQRGSTMTLVAITLPVLLAFLALAVDMGYAYSQRRLTQGSADSAAVAGALMMGKRIGERTGDHDVYNATIEARQGMTRNTFESRNFWMRADYVNDDNTFSELVGIPCGATPNEATGIHVYTERSLPTAFGNMLNVAARLANPGPADETQTIRFSGLASGGYFWLTLEGGDYWTWALRHDASADEIQSALQALPQVGDNNVRVTGNPGGPFIVTFINGRGEQNIIQMSIATDLAGGVTAVVTTDRNGTGARRELTVTSDATAYLRSITAVDAADGDFAPFAVYVGRWGACKADAGRTVTLWHPQYKAAVVDVDCSGNQVADVTWTGQFNTFTGYLGELAGELHVNQTILSDSPSTPPLTQLQHAYGADRPLLLPVFTGQSGNYASIRLALAGFVWAKLTSNPTSGRPITARVISWATTGKEYSREWGSPAGSNALAKTVALGR